jgi:hypothetical protein
VSCQTSFARKHDVEPRTEAVHWHSTTRRRSWAIDGELECRIDVLNHFHGGGFAVDVLQSPNAIAQEQNSGMTITATKRALYA